MACRACCACRSALNHCILLLLHMGCGCQDHGNEPQSVGTEPCRVANRAVWICAMRFVLMMPNVQVGVIVVLT